MNTPTVSPPLIYSDESMPSFSKLYYISDHSGKKSNHGRNLIIKDPTMVPPGSLLFFLSKLGDVENLTNFFGTLPHELTGNLETGEIKEWLNRHEVGSRNQIKQHWLINPLEKILIPLLLHIPLEGVILEGGLDLCQFLFVVMVEKFNHLLEAAGFYLEDLDVFGTINVTVVVFVIGIPDHVGETGSGVWPVERNNKNDGIVGERAIFIWRERRR